MNSMDPWPPVEPDHVQTPERERCVADPGTGSPSRARRQLGQRGRNRGHGRPRRPQVNPLSASAERCKHHRHGWSGKSRAPASAAKVLRALDPWMASSAVSGPLSSSRHDRHENARSPAFRVRVPIAESPGSRAGCRREGVPSACRVRGLLLVFHHPPLVLLHRVVEGRFAHHLHLHLAVYALHVRTLGVAGPVRERLPDPRPHRRGRRGSGRRSRTGPRAARRRAPARRGQWSAYTARWRWRWCANRPSTTRWRSTSGGWSKTSSRPRTRHAAVRRYAFSATSRSRSRALPRWALAP